MVEESEAMTPPTEPRKRNNTKGNKPMSTQIALATKILARSTGCHIARNVWSVSETNTLANHDLDLVSADDIIESLEGADEVTVTDATEDEAVEAYIGCPSNDQPAASYKGMAYVKIVVVTKARGMHAGTRCEYIAPESGW